MNPVPVLQTVDMCGKMQEVSIFDPKHCKVGTRCAYNCMDVGSVFAASVHHITVVLDYSEYFTVGRWLNLHVETPVIVLPCTCSQPQRTGSKCPPVWPLHST